MGCIVTYVDDTLLCLIVPLDLKQAMELQNHERVMEWMRTNKLRQTLGKADVLSVGFS